MTENYKTKKTAKMTVDGKDYIVSCTKGKMIDLITVECDGIKTTYQETEITHRHGGFIRADKDDYCLMLAKAAVGMFRHDSKIMPGQKCHMILKERVNRSYTTRRDHVDYVVKIKENLFGTLKCIVGIVDEERVIRKWKYELPYLHRYVDTYSEEDGERYFKEFCEYAVRRYGADNYHFLKQYRQLHIFQTGIC